MDNTSPIADIYHIYNTQLEVFQLIENSDLYFYTIDPLSEFYKQEVISSSATPQIPHLMVETLITFYTVVINQMKTFSQDQFNMAANGREFAKMDLTVLELHTISRQISQETNNLIAGFRAFNTAKAAPGKGFFRRTELERLLIKRFIQENLSGEKPEIARETLRRYLPRFVTHPIPYPEDLLPSTAYPEVASLWKSYTVKDAHYLIHPDKITEGVPFHLVVRLARTFESMGQDDVGYTLRVHAVSHLLSMEKERSLLSEKAEIPFFTYMLKGIIPGSTFKSLLQSSATFNYDEALNETIYSAVQRFQQELIEGPSGVATAFMHQLNDYYPQDFTRLLAHAIFNFNRGPEQVDEFDVLGKLQEISWMDFSALLEHAKEVPARIVLSFDEIGSILSQLPKYMIIEGPFNFSEDIKLLVEDGDSFSYKQDISKSKIKTGDPTFGLKIEVEPLSEIVYASLISIIDKKVRAISFTLAFSGDSATFTTRLFDRTLADKAIVEDMHWRVITVLHDLAEKKRLRDRTMQPSLPVTPHQESFSIDTPHFTHDERKARYEMRKELEQQNLKRKHVHNGDKNLVPEETVTVSRETQAQNQDHITRTISGLNYSEVTTLLQKERITVVDADAVIKKLQHLVQLANVSGKMLGKRISTEVLPLDELAGEHINLRQINWIVDGGVTQIRIYIEDVKHGSFALRGIMLKKNESQQSRYIGQVLRDIVRGRQR